jgi:hypothetical protein
MVNDFGFDLNIDSVTKSEKFSEGISETGAYVGMFDQVYRLVSEKGSEAMVFTFKSEKGGRTNFTVWYKASNVKNNARIESGYESINSIMASIGIRSIKGYEGVVSVYDKGMKVEKDLIVYPDLCDKDVGVVLQKELFTKNNGEDGYRFNFILSFDAKTRQTASEKVCKSSEAKKLEKVLATLKDKDNRTVKITNNNSVTEILDDVPF